MILLVSNLMPRRSKVLIQNHVRIKITTFQMKVLIVVEVKRVLVVELACILVKMRSQLIWSKRRHWILRLLQNDVSKRE